jgi:hypothetical protein
MLKAGRRSTHSMPFNACIVALYSLVGLCIWWLIENAGSVWSWIYFFPVVLSAGFALDYLIGRWKQRVDKHYQ